ncbi:enolase superfamily member [Anaeramoeba flamelloides]|uniref:Enolase superfamily member n=1 Tax=Anaeramoeba flamelloides TaxID=1746091 RepID=A0ABQ8YC90_9EUKA|nr:enolase superfamily member [Anaeramoeba flamelloides]
MSQLFKLENHTIEIKQTKYPLTLRTLFGTSHSKTNTRTNCLISVCLDSSRTEIGYGEIGLPPKKPNCYLADPQDISLWFEAFYDYLEKICKTKNKEKSFDFELPLKKNEWLSAVELPNWFLLLLYAIDTFPANNEKYSKAAQNGIEGACLDLLSKCLNLPLWKIITNNKNKNKNKNKNENENENENNKTQLVELPAIPAFYTIGINTNSESILTSLKFGLKFTCNLKLKASKDLDLLFKTFEIIEDYQKENQKNEIVDKINGIWSIDANADWTPEISLQFLDRLDERLKKKIYMVEQPFPLQIETLEKSEIEAWKVVKSKYLEAGIRIYADESVSTVDSVMKVAPFSHGVNVKLEKAGGIRQAIQTIHEAQNSGLTIWIGMMVGSVLASNMAGSIALLAGHTDADGGLLVTDECQPFEGGFDWDKSNGTITLSKEPGFGTISKEN